LATSAMDLSDGLSTDLPRLCSASGVGARIYAEKLPLVNLPLSAQPAHRGDKSAPVAKALELALHGGDDYELLFTVPQSKQASIPPSFEGVPLILIGEITANRKIVLVGKSSSSTVLKPRGWDPFRERR